MIAFASVTTRHLCWALPQIFREALGGLGQQLDGDFGRNSYQCSGRIDSFSNRKGVEAVAHFLLKKHIDPVHVDTTMMISFFQSHESHWFCARYISACRSA